MYSINFLLKIQAALLIGPVANVPCPAKAADVEKLLLINV